MPDISPVYRHRNPQASQYYHKVFRMLLRKGKITEEVVKLIMSWRH
ncbi:MAG: hypothetical protein JRJ85_17740 [Deltaproteobacteria bacterium]|nr:hypothetical protein [Deltaproteobacteria bacterium]